MHILQVEKAVLNIFFFNLEDCCTERKLMFLLRPVSQKTEIAGPWQYELSSLIIFNGH